MENYLYTLSRKMNWTLLKDITPTYFIYSIIVLIQIKLHEYLLTFVTYKETCIDYNLVRYVVTRKKMENYYGMDISKNLINSFRF